LITLTNEYFPPRGNWKGLDPGRVLAGWLARLLSQANYRLSQGQHWASKRIQTLSGRLGRPVQALDFSDDRLASLSDVLSEGETGNGTSDDGDVAPGVQGYFSGLCTSRRALISPFTPLSELQSKILGLFNVSSSIYSVAGIQFFKSALKMSEPRVL